MHWLAMFQHHNKVPTALDLSQASNLSLGDVKMILHAMETLGHVIVQKKQGQPTRFRVFNPNR